MSAYVYPGAYNVYQPSIEASGKLMVDFSRNPARFPVTSYTQIIKVEKNAGLYIRHDPDEAARALTATGDEFIWADGAASPDNYIDKEFQFPAYVTRRYAFPFSLGNLTIEQAAWDIVSNYAATAAALAMTQRARLALGKLTDPTQMTQTATAATLIGTGGTYLNTGSSTNPYLRLGLQAAMQQILLNTDGVVQPNDLMIVVNPVTAKLLAVSNEVIDFIKQSPFVTESLKFGGNYAVWGLPDYLFGLKVIVEDTVVVTSNKGAARVSSFALPNDIVLIVSKVGGLETTDGTFSTVAMFSMEEMTTETYADGLNRRLVGRVVEDIDFEIVSPISGYLITAATNP